MGEERLVKANFICTVTTVEKITDENGNEVLKVKESKNEKWRGKEFTDAMYADRVKDINHTIKIVNGKPNNFQLNVLYILADGTRMWIWVKEEDMIDSEKAQVINDIAAGEQQTIESGEEA